MKWLRRRGWRRRRRHVGVDRVAGVAGNDRFGLDQSSERGLVDEPLSTEDGADFFCCETTLNAVALHRTPGGRLAVGGCDTLQDLSHGEGVFEIIGEGGEHGDASV